MMTVLSLCIRMWIISGFWNESSTEKSEWTVKHRAMSHLCNSTYPPAVRGHSTWTSSLTELVDQTVLFIGDSTTRELYLRAVRLLNMSNTRLPCNYSLNHGCFDCRCGCHSSYYYAHNDTDWVDMLASSPTSSVRLEFSWKPEMFTHDDVRYFQVLSTRKHILAVFVQKSVHDAVNWIGHFEPAGVPNLLYTEELTVRSSLLADTLTNLRESGRTLIVWREAYTNFVHPKLEEKLVVIRNITNQIMAKHGFIVLPTQELTPKNNSNIRSPDGTHQHDSVKDLVLDLFFFTVFDYLYLKNDTVRAKREASKHRQRPPS